MLQDVLQSFIGEPNRVPKAIPDHLHSYKIRQRAIRRNLPFAALVGGADWCSEKRRGRVGEKSRVRGS